MAKMDWACTRLDLPRECALPSTLELTLIPLLVPLLPLLGLGAPTLAHGDGDTQATPLLLPLLEPLLLGLLVLPLLAQLPPLPVSDAPTPADGDARTRATPLLLMGDGLIGNGAGDIDASRLSLGLLKDLGKRTSSKLVMVMGITMCHLGWALVHHGIYQSY